MAEIYASPQGEAPVNNNNIGGQVFTGNPDVDSYINSLPQEERKDAYDKITAPKSGEEIHRDMLAADEAGQVYDPNKEDWMKLNDFYKTKETDIFDSLSGAAGSIYQQFAKAGSSLADNPSDITNKLAPSVVEAFGQSTRMMYGIVAQSANSTSPQSRFFNALNGVKENSDAAYREFLDARNFLREGRQLEKGETSLIIKDKDLLNNDVVQAASYVADPSWFIPFGGIASGAAHAVGLGEKAMMVSAKIQGLKALVVGGGLKYGVGFPIEFVGKATRGTLDYAAEKAGQGFEAIAGVSKDDFRNGLKAAGVGSLSASALGHSIPYASATVGVGTATYGASVAASGIGEAVGLVGDQILQGERGLASYAKRALNETAKRGVEISPQARALLKLVNGFDPLIDYGTHVAEGAFTGSAIGAGLGWWSEGTEGAAAGAGAGLALGSIGATTGRLASDAFGATRKMRTNIEAQFVLRGLDETAPAQANMWRNAETWANAKGFSFDGILAAKDIVHPDTSIHLRSNEGNKEFLLSKGLDPEKYDGMTILPDGDMPLSQKTFEHNNGYVVENSANGSVQIHINADNASRATLPHEVLHSILRTSVMKDYYVSELKSRILGERDNAGNEIQRGVIKQNEVNDMFRRYIDAEFSQNPEAHADALKRLQMAQDKWTEGGQMVADAELGGRPLLEHLAEEFGAYYFSHLVMNKPIDWLYHAGDLPGIRGVLENVNLSWTEYWRDRMNFSHPEFDFNRTYTDKDGIERLVPIDEVFKPYRGSRVINPAMERFFKDMLKIERHVNQTGVFDINALSKDARQRFIDGNGLDGVFTKQPDGTYRHNTEAQIAKENKIKGKNIYKMLMGVPDNLRTFTTDGEGVIRGPFSDELVDQMINSGHMSREFGNKLKMAQKVISGDIKGNLIDFGGIGVTAERAGDVNNPSRMWGKNVPFKSRTGLLYGLDIAISKDGDYTFKANMLDYKVIELRLNNMWADPNTQKLWNGNSAEFKADFYRYLENASKNAFNPDGTVNSDRVPSAQLWTDGLGEDRRNVMHQALGLAKGEADTFLNSPLAEIKRNSMSSVFDFSLNRMTNVRVRSQSLPYTHANAYKDLVRNWSPNEMHSEETSNGRTFWHPSGFRAIQYKGGQTDAFDENGNKIGRFPTSHDAAEAMRKRALKEPSSVLLASNMNDGDKTGEFGRKYDLASSEWKSSFLGKFHELNKDKIDPDGKLTLKLVQNSPYRLKIELHHPDMDGINGSSFATISANIDRFKDAATIGFSTVDNPKFTGKGFGKLLYSEMAERLRASNVKYMDGMLVGREPVGIRRKMFGSLMREVEDEVGQKSFETIPASVANEAIRGDKYYTLPDLFTRLSRFQAEQLAAKNNVSVDRMVMEHRLKEQQNSLFVRNELDPNTHYSPHEAGGEEAMLSPDSLEYKTFKDSFKTYEKYNLPSHMEPRQFDPTLFESLVGHAGGTKDPFATVPNPRINNLWQYLDYHQKKKSTVLVKDILKYITDMGDSIHPNVANDYHSKIAKYLMAMAEDNQLNLPVHINAGKTWHGGINDIAVGTQYEARVTREATLQERYAQLVKSIDPESIREAANLKKEIDTIKIGIEEKNKRAKRISGDEEVEDGVEQEQQKDAKFRFPQIVVTERKSHQPFHLNLAQLIDKAWIAQKRQYNIGDYSGSEYKRRVQALSGHSFEGTALEEMGHSLLAQAEAHAMGANPELKNLLLTYNDNPDTGSNLKGQPWARGVDAFISRTELRIANGITLPKSEVAFARILALQRWMLKNTFIQNEKTGAIEPAWTSKGVVLNKATHTEKGKPSSNRGAVEKGYVVASPWDYARQAMSSNRTGGSANAPATNSYLNQFLNTKGFELESPELKLRSVYRLISTAEFQIALFNDPQLMGQWSLIPEHPELLKALETPETKAGLLPNISDLNYQVSEAVSQFVTSESKPTKTILNQLINEITNVLDAGRRSPNDILLTDLQNERGINDKLPERPVGYLDSNEKIHVNEWREKMNEWAIQNNKKSPLEGLSDWQIWKKLKTGFEGMNSVKIGVMKPRSIEETSVQSVSNVSGLKRDIKKVPPSPQLTNKGNPVTAGMWNENTKRYELITGDEHPVQEEVHEPVVDTETGTHEVTEDGQKIYIEEDGTKYIIDTEGNKIEIDENRKPIIDTETGKLKIVPPKIPPVVEPKVPPVVQPKVPPVVPTPNVPKPPVPMPKRDYTKADISVWRSWKTETYSNGSSLSNALGWIIMQQNGNFRVYNPYKQLMGIYKDEEQAKRRVQREEPKR